MSGLWRAGPGAVQRRRPRHAAGRACGRARREPRVLYRRQQRGGVRERHPRARQCRREGHRRRSRLFRRAVLPGWHHRAGDRYGRCRRRRLFLRGRQQCRHGLGVGQPELQDAVIGPDQCRRVPAEFRYQRCDHRDRAADHGRAAAAGRVPRHHHRVGPALCHRGGGERRRDQPDRRLRDRYDRRLPDRPGLCRRQRDLYGPEWPRE